MSSDKAHRKEVSLHRHYGVEDGRDGKYASCPPTHPGMPRDVAKAYREGFAAGRAEREGAA